MKIEAREPRFGVESVAVPDGLLGRRRDARRRRHVDAGPGAAGEGAREFRALRREHLLRLQNECFFAELGVDTADFAQNTGDACGGSWH